MGLWNGKSLVGMEIGSEGVHGVVVDLCSIILHGLLKIATLESSVENVLKSI